MIELFPSWFMALPNDKKKMVTRWQNHRAVALLKFSEGRMSGEFCYHMEQDTHDDIEVVGEYETKKEAEENFRLETIEEWLKGLNLCGEIACRIDSHRGLAAWDKVKKKFVFEGVKI